MDAQVREQLREQRLQDTPLAITAVNSEMFEARKFINDDDYSPLGISNGNGKLDYWGFTQ